MPTVAIVDYGSGNLRSAAKAFERAARECASGHDVVVSGDPRVVERAERIVLPGVGAFADCRAGLYAVAGMVEILQREAVERQAVLGICVGMQWMATRGVEYGTHLGLDQGRRAHHARRPPPQDPAHGLERSSTWPRPIRCSRASRRATMPFRALYGRAPSRTTRCWRAPTTAASSSRWSAAPTWRAPSSIPRRASAPGSP